MMKRRELVGKGDIKQGIDYADICKTIKKKAKEDIMKYNHDIKRETILASRSLKNVRTTQLLGQDRLVTPLDKQGSGIRDQD